MTQALVATTIPPADQADDALVIAARDDPEAFGHLYSRYFPSVYRYIRARSATC